MYNFIMTLSVFFSILFFTFYAHANENLKCEAQINTIVQSYGYHSTIRPESNSAVNEWKSDGHQFFRTEKSERGIALSRITKHTMTQFSFTNKCHLKVNYRILPKISFTEFDLDLKLKRSQQDKSKGFIYLWSPHMPLSISGISEAKLTAKEMNLDLTIVSDENASASSLKILLKNKQIHEGDVLPLLYESLSRLHKDQLTYVHFPTLFLYDSGQLVSTGLPGFLDHQHYSFVAKKIFAREKL